METAVIFGISGQDGTFLADFLLKKNYRVIGISRDVQGSSFQNLQRLGIKDKIELVSASIHDFRSVLQIISNYKPNEIYNLAGQSSVGLSFDQPVETFESISIANLNLLEVIRFLDIPIKFYNAGSSDCFGNTLGRKVTEQDPFKPRSPYGVAKAAAYWQVSNYREAYNIFACTGILFNHESFLRSERFVTQKIVKTACRIAAGSDEKLLLGDISIERDWGWAPEYVGAMWSMLQQEKPDDYIVATGKTYSLTDFISEVFRTLNLDWKNHVKSNNIFLRPIDIQSIKANPEKAKKILGWKARHCALDVARLMVEAELQKA
jgi:GDPmannose 4,6-dehydratase